MRTCNIKFTAIATYSSGIDSKARFFVTEQAVSNWANKQYNKDNGVTVTVWNGIMESVYCVYHE